MSYKVFLVENEIVAREGIRDNVDWTAMGFEFYGEACDGEVALPLIEAGRPDVLITDIKMPFMNGLQLSRIVKEKIPEVKIIILSGHDEFEYAREAVKLGVTEYLLKPIEVQDLHNVLARVAAQLDQERVSQTIVSALPEENEIDKTKLLKLNKTDPENFLAVGSPSEFDTFFTYYIQPLSQNALASPLIRNYIFMDIVLATARYVRQLGGDVEQIVPDLHQIDKLLPNITSIDMLCTEIRQIFERVLVFRDSQTSNPYTAMLQHAKSYIDRQAGQPELSLNDVAEHVNLSPSHFSTIFSRENSETFKEYLTRIRIERAKELLKTTTLKASEISDQVGYRDPHYFSAVFKKVTGLSPRQFRMQTRFE